MAKRRLSMRKTKEILRLKWACQQSNRQIAKSCHVSHSTVGQCLMRAEQAGLSWPLDPELDDAYPITGYFQCCDIHAKSGDCSLKYARMASTRTG